MKLLVTPAGRLIRLTGSPPQGRSHSMQTGYDEVTGQAVVVKMGGDGARLRHECLVLTALADAPSTLAPRLLEAVTENPDPYLLLEHLPGRPPETPADWAAFGAILAELHNATIEATALCRSSSDLLGPAAKLAAAQAPHLLAVVHACADAAAGSVMIHGDASAQNVLVCGHHATLIDFENASFGHPGLDLGRVVFLVLLDGFPARYSHIRSFLGGYQHQRPLPDRLPVWACLAGILIAAWRYGHDHDHAPPWQDALALVNVLNDN